MNTTASSIVIFSVWIAGIVCALYLFLPTITASMSSIETYSHTVNDTELKTKIGLDEEANYTAYTPLGIFDLLRLNF